MRCFAGSLILTLLVSTPAWAGVLRIVDLNIVWSPGGSPSPSCFVLIVNDQSVTDRLASWQLSLVITPDENATGTVQFVNADLPRQSTDNYLLAEDSYFLGDPTAPPVLPIAGPTNNISIYDYAAFSIFGNVVPSTEKTLLKVNFLASEDAQGVFEIAALPGENQSFWASFDENDDGNAVRGFENIPLGAADPVIIGHVTVIPVPEPPGLLLLLIMVITWTFGCRIR